jgi:two-component system, response regulator PdtaR
MVTFRVRLRGHGTQIVALEEPMDRPAGNAEPKVILVVEDEIFIRMGLADDLIQAGFRVLQASDADEALRILRTSEPVDLLLTDVWMPGAMDGVQLAAVARSMRPQLKIAILSGHVLTPPPEANVLFGKPYVTDRLIDSIQKLLGDDGQ